MQLGDQDKRFLEFEKNIIPSVNNSSSNNSAASNESMQSSMISNELEVIRRERDEAVKSNKQLADLVAALEYQVFIISISYFAYSYLPILNIFLSSLLLLLLLDRSPI